MLSGILNFLEPSGPLQACNGTALPFTWLPKRIYVLNINWLSCWKSIRSTSCRGMQRGEGGAKCSFFFVCLFRCASKRFCSVKHTDPLYMLNTYVVIPTSAVRCSRRNVFSTDQYTGIQSQSKPSSRHQLQGASGWTSHGHPFWNVHEPSEDIRKPQCSTSLPDLFWTFAFSIRSVGFLRNALTVRKAYSNFRMLICAAWTTGGVHLSWMNRPLNFVWSHVVSLGLLYEVKKRNLVWDHVRTSLTYRTVCHIFMEYGIEIRALSSIHEFRENRLIDIRVTCNGVNEFIPVLITFLGQFGWNSLQGMCTSFCGAFMCFLKIGARKFVVFVWVHMKLHGRVYHALMWHFIRK